MSEKINAALVSQASDLTHLLERDTTPWYRKNNLRRLYLTLVPAALGVEMTSGYDTSVLNGLQSVAPWNEFFGSPTGTLLGIVTASFSFGAVLGIPLVPFVNDRYGRKASIIVGTCFLTIGVIIQTAAINLVMFIMGRFVMGIGIPYAINGASQLIAELSYPKERPVITGLFNESWYVGSIIAAGVTFGTYQMNSSWSWRLPSLFQCLPSMLQIIFIWFVPESPRWLLSKDRGDEAFEILAKYHAEGNREDLFVLAEFQQIRETIQLEMESRKTSYRELFKSRANIHRLAIAACVGLFTQWAGNGLVSYYLSKVLSTIGITALRKQQQVNVSLQCWNLVSGVFGAFMTKFLTRRQQYLIAFGSMTVIFAAWTAASANYAQTANDQAAGAVVAMIFIYYGFYNLMMPLTYIYITEVFPFIIRSNGVATLQLFSRSATAFNQFVNPIGLVSLAWKYYFVYVSLLAAETTTIFFLFPETKGPSLEELAMVFEGKGANVGTIDLEAKAVDVGETAHVESVSKA